MNERDYREAFDKLRFSEDFEARTVELLRRQLRDTPGKETEIMKRIKHKRAFWRVAIAVALVAVLSVTAAAAWSWSSFAPARDMDKAAQAYEEGHVIPVGKSVEIDGLSYYISDVSTLMETDPLGHKGETVPRTYVNLCIARTDGVPFTVDENDPDGWVWDVYDHCYFTPLISGCDPTQVNSWTSLNTDKVWNVKDGVLQCQLVCDGLDVFSDRTVYLAYYEGLTTPSKDIFTMAEDGTISFVEGYDKTHILFELEMDESTADPELAEHFLQKGHDWHWGDEHVDTPFPEEGFWLSDPGIPASEPLPNSEGDFVKTIEDDGSITFSITK